MIRWLAIATMAGLAVAGTARWLPPAQAESSVVDAALWRAAGVVRLPVSIQAPPLRLNDLSGELVDLRQLRGQLVMVYFWATW
jgi:hypothetical protein